MRNTRLYSKIETFRREDIPAYSEIAVREVFVNALSHTDYFLTGKRIVHSCRSGGYPEPEWIELGSVMRVVFHPHPEASEEQTGNVPVNQRQQWFIKQIQRDAKVSAKDIAEHWKVSEKTAKRDITDLKQKSV